MDPNHKKMILAQIGMAKQKLKASRVLLREELFGDSISRAYYSTFHAITAVLLAEGITIESHRALKYMFGLHLIKTGRIDKKFSAILKRLNEARNRGDYDAFMLFGESEAETALQQAKEFLKAMKQYLAKSHKLKF